MTLSDKSMKKIHNAQQFSVDFKAGMEYLIKELSGQRIYTEPLKKIVKDLETCEKKLAAITNEEKTATEKEVKDITGTLKHFSLRRVFATKGAAMKENARQLDLLVKEEPKLKQVTDTEKRIVDSFKQLEHQAKKQKEIARKLGL